MSAQVTYGEHSWPSSPSPCPDVSNAKVGRVRGNAWVNQITSDLSHEIVIEVQAGIDVSRGPNFVQWPILNGTCRMDDLKSRAKMYFFSSFAAVATSCGVSKEDMAGFDGRSESNGAGSEASHF